MQHSHLGVQKLLTEVPTRQLNTEGVFAVLVLVSAYQTWLNYVVDLENPPKSLKVFISSNSLESLVSKTNRTLRP